jgi:dihydropteroate synthase
LKGIPEQSLFLEWSTFFLDLGQRTHVMGILNVTPDSFSDGGQFFHKERAIEQGLAMAEDGADIIDVGGESTRPYSERVTKEEELDRVIPVIEGLRKSVRIPLSIDTLKAEVAREALRAGAAMVNDISALRFDPGMAAVVAEAEVPVILMHMKGTPDSMQDKPVYGNLIQEIIDFLRAAEDRAVQGGIRREMTIVDPGIGFGKTFDHNLEIIRELSRFHRLGRPVLLGSSRKAFIGHILDRPAHERDTGTMATVAAAVMNGAHIVRVHDVKRAVETVKVMDAIKRGKADNPESRRWEYNKPG